MLAEGMSMGTFSFFFIGTGALATSAACYLFPAIAASVTKQLLLFSAMSLLSLLLLRSRIMRLVNNKTRPDGSEVFIGKRGKALTNLSKNGIDTGRVLFEGTEWAASPTEDSPEIPTGSAVEIVQIEGLTLKVRLIQNI
jgi:membrane protein implicated in regulation of membrane protease activity